MIMSNNVIKCSRKLFLQNLWKEILTNIYHTLFCHLVGKDQNHFTHHLVLTYQGQEISLILSPSFCRICLHSMNSPNPQKYSSTMDSLKILHLYGAAQSPYPNCIRKCSLLCCHCHSFKKICERIQLSCFEGLTQTWGDWGITAVADGKTRNVPCFSACPHTDSGKISLDHF